MTYTLDASQIPTTGSHKTSLSRILTAIELDYEEITKVNRKRYLRKPATEAKTEKPVRAVFVPISDFARHMSQAELKRQEAAREEAEYRSLLEAFTRLRMHEAYNALKIKQEIINISDFT